MQERLSIGIVGASGYTGEELVRLILAHPRLDLAVVTSRQYAGKPLAEIFPHLPLPPTLLFSSPNPAELAPLADVFFLALPHGEARRYAEPLLAAGRRVLDLSADFRIRDTAQFQAYYDHEPAPQSLLDQAVYGSPETHRDEIPSARLIACPGCYPTSVLLAMAPALAKGWIKPDSIVINSMSGVSGAGRKADVALLFAECNESVKAYGIARHRHVPEIEQELSRMANQPVTVQFTPHLLPVTRGILTTITCEPSGKLPEPTELQAHYEAFYAEAPFVRVCRPPMLPEIRHVARTNRCDVAARTDPRTGRLLFFSAEDNLTKGAAGQAIQCLNLMMNWPETEGLPL
jgi:N-acetyl-gamma-glutamyl-phosphate reductase